jgi:hypothetical protein
VRFITAAADFYRHPQQNTILILSWEKFLDIIIRKGGALIGALKRNGHQLDARKSFQILAPQVGLEPTTLRLTAKKKAFHPFSSVPPVSCNYIRHSNLTAHVV